jgi:arylsulfate sulfotransferase
VFALEALMRSKTALKYAQWLSIALLLHGCSDRVTSPQTTSTPDIEAHDMSHSDTVDTYTTMPDITAYVDSPEPISDIPPVPVDWIENMSIAEVESMPLAAVVTFKTTISCETSMLLSGPDVERSLPETARLTEKNGLEHQFLVLGMRAEESYELTAQAFSEEEADAMTQVWSTPSLPEDFPPITVLHSNPEKMGAGVTFLGVNTVGANGKTNPSLGLVLGLDTSGEVVWYHQPGKGVQGIKVLHNGNLMFVSGGKAQTEVSVWGEQINVLSAQNLGLDSMHHSFHPLPDGHLLVLSSELRLIDGYPDGETNAVVGDVIVELDAEGEILSQWSLFDLLDPYRIIHGWDTSFWSKTYPDAPGGAKDWTHCNSVVVDEDDGAILVSSRHQDIVFKMSTDPFEFMWVLGEDAPSTSGDDDWPFLELVGEGRYPSEQHAASLLSNGNLLLYDNGTAAGMSRAVEYALNLNDMTVTQVWEFADPDYDPPLFSRTAGSAVELPGGNILIADAALKNPLGETSKDTYGRVVEVTHTTPPEKVFEVALRNPEVLGENAYRSFAAIRVADIYELLPSTE